MPARNDRSAAWRPLAELLAHDPCGLRARIDRLDLPPVQRALLLELLERRGR